MKDILFCIEKNGVYSPISIPSEKLLDVLNREGYSRKISLPKGIFINKVI